MNAQEIEDEVVDKGLTAPRITAADLEAAVAGEAYHVFEGTCTTVCCITVRNGFTVVGHSAPASPANFDEELGRKIARARAVEQLWPLEGYLLRERLSDDGE